MSNSNEIAQNLAEVFERIKVISKMEKKSLLQRTAKVAEELGELSAAVLASEGASGMSYKDIQFSQVGKEAVDVILVAFSICHKINLSDDEIIELFHQKCDKWVEKMG